MKNIWKTSLAYICIATDTRKWPLWCIAWWFTIASLCRLSNAVWLHKVQRTSDYPAPPNNSSSAKLKPNSLLWWNTQISAKNSNRGYRYKSYWLSSWNEFMIFHLNISVHSASQHCAVRRRIECRAVHRADSEDRNWSQSITLQRSSTDIGWSQRGSCTTHHSWSPATAYTC